MALTGVIMISMYLFDFWNCTYCHNIDDILLTGCITGVLIETKDYLKQHFVTKWESLGIFLIEVAYQKNRLFLSQRKYVMDQLQETGLLVYNHIAQLWRQMGISREKIEHLRWYQAIQKND